MADLRAIARAKARKYGLDPNVFVRQIQQESGFRDVRSPAGAQGVAQFIPSTAAAYGVNVHDPVSSLDGAARYMRDNVKKYGSYARALSAYNSGRPDAYKDPSFARGETYNYVKTILGGSNPRAPSGGSSNNGGQQGASTTRIPGFNTPGINLPGVAGTSVNIVEPQIDQAGFEDARRRSVLGEMIAKHNPNSFLLRSGLLSTQEPVIADYVTNKTSTVKIPGIPGLNLPGSRLPGLNVTTPGSSGGSGGGAVPSGKGRVVVNGKPVTAELAKAVAVARRYGWRGQVTSGIRSKSEQIAAATRFGLSHYGPAGPLGSNHVEGHSGAVDVSDPDGFEAALRRAKKAGYKGRLPFRAMKDDPVHFSWTGH